MPIFFCTTQHLLLERADKSGRKSTAAVYQTMDSLLKQMRVRASGLGQDIKEESNSIRERKRPPQQTKSFKGDKTVRQNWFRRQFSSQMSLDHDSRNGEFETAIAAAAFAIYSLQETGSKKQEKTRDGLDATMTKPKSRKEDTTIGLPDSSRVSTGFSVKEGKDAGEAPMRESRAQDRKASESAFTTSKPSHPSSVRPNHQVAGDSARHIIETKADAWQTTEKKKIKKRYEKMNSTIHAWENEKKMKAKLVMERKKSELEQRRARNFLHYQSKIARIEHIAGGARAQAEEKRRNEECDVKEKAKKIKSTGKVPVMCFCF